LLEKYNGRNDKWTDPDFPPNDKSWGAKGEKVVWKRATDIIKNPQFVSDNFTPADILQGKIGNCYFLSAIAGLAERPYRIRKIFPNTNLNANGIYVARLLHKGVYQEVIVDDYFPCNQSGVLLGSQPAGGS
jgi:calpain-15